MVYCNRNRSDDTLLAGGSLVEEDDKKAPTTASIREVEAISHYVQQAAAVRASFIAVWSAPRSWIRL
jgi:hypothetical protein